MDLFIGHVQNVLLLILQYLSLLYHDTHVEYTYDSSDTLHFNAISLEPIHTVK